MPKSEATSHRFLEIAPYHLSKAKAVRRVLNLLSAMNPSVPLRDWRRKKIQMNTVHGPVHPSFDDLVQEARMTGTVSTVRRHIDINDPVFGGTFDMAADREMLTLKVEYAGYSAKLKAPARNNPIENELSEDILTFRRRCCTSSADFPYNETARCYRGYLTSGISVIEAFMNRHVLLAEHNKDTRSVIAELRDTTRFDRRLELWMAAFTNRGLSALKAFDQEWSGFQELRKERNRLVHATEPYLGLELKSLPRKLNLVNFGVGGFLTRLREMQGLRSLGFIERLETAPKIRFVSQKRKRR